LAAVLSAAFSFVAIGGLASAAVPAAGDAPRLEPEDQIVLSGSVRIPRGTTLGEVVVFSGSVTVAGVAEGDIVVFEGPVVVSGQVNGSVIAADGPVELRESALVGGDVFSSEPIRADPGAKVAGELRGRVRFSLEGPLAALGKLLGPVAIAVSVLLTGLLLLALAPRGADAVAETLADAPFASLGWGVLIALSAPVMAVALCVLVLGVPLGLALLLSLGLWWLVGLTWAAWCAGRGLVRPPRGRLAAFLAGWAILAAVGLVPVLNAAAWTLASPIGLGAMVVAAWRARRPGHPGGRHRRRTAAPQDDAIQAGIA
jgi:cytoskeletal protein CcmA (bactofilin family)